MKLKGCKQEPLEGTLNRIPLNNPYIEMYIYIYILY